MSEKKKGNLGGAHFERELVDSCKALGWHYVKIPVATTPNTRFATRPPYDLFTATSGVAFALEAKSLSEKKSFPFSSVRDDQVLSLTEAWESGLPTAILLNFREARECYAIPWQVFQALERTLVRRSIPLSFFLEQTPDYRKIPRTHITNAAGKKTLIWDLRELFRCERLFDNWSKYASRVLEELTGGRNVE